jgi:long-chain acyl-CoA synthetase
MAARTLIRLFLDTVDTWHKPAQFMRRGGQGWESIPADRALADVESLALGLRALGVGRGERVAILSESRYEWVVTDLAVVGQGAVTVPIYSTLTPDQCRAILADSGARAVVVSTADQLAKVRAVRAQLPQLGAVVVMDPGPEPGPAETTWSAVCARGAEARKADPLAFRTLADAVQPGDLATIIYTSGTTGEPKGAMLSHANISSNVAGGLDVIDLGPSDTCLSFLPLSHIFERMAGCYTMLTAGVTIAFARSIDTVAADAAEVRPTLLVAVPRFFEKVRTRVLENARTMPLLRRSIFYWGLGEGRRRARAHLAWRRHVAPLAPLADHLVAAKVRARMGGRLRMCFSGGAALHPMVLEFFFAMGIPIVEGYGLTETSPIICLTPAGRERPGAVGPVLPGVEARIGEDGEILTRGPHVMMGYWNNPAATDAAIRDGWFHTGDLGHFDEDGYLHITDRLKDLIVTAGGKNVAPQPIEARLKASKWVTEAVLIGEQRPYITALLVPNFERLEGLARRNDWPFASRKELLERPEILAIVQRRLDRLNEPLAPFERVRRFALLDHEMTQEGGELTPSLKVRRRVVRERYAELIESLYATPAAPIGGAENPGHGPQPEEN